jgi:hypothetical protein
MAVKAFPTAEGFGANALGGRGGDVYFVTKLTDDGSSGTLRHALSSQVNGSPRTVIFRVGGTITLTSDLVINKPYLTIAGQTAPGGGIQLRNYDLTIHKTHDVIVRFLRVRPGVEAVNLSTGKSTNAIAIYSGDSPGWVKTYNVIVDHCTAMWSTDQNMDAYGWIQDVTYQWCVCAEGTLLGEEGNPTSSHSCGSIMATEPWSGDVLRISIHHCVYAQNGDRSPLCNPYLNASLGTLTLRLDYRNNVIYNWNGNGNCFNVKGGFYSTTGQSNWGTATGNGTALELNIVGNRFIKGPNSSGSSIGYIGPYIKAFLEGNICPLSPSTPVNGFNIGLDWWKTTDAGSVQFVSWPTWGTTIGTGPHTLGSPFTVPIPVTTQPIGTAYDLVLNNAGPAFVVRNGVSTSIRDTVDARIVNEVRTLTGEVGGGITYNDWVNSGQRHQYPTIANGTPYPDSNNDGIQDGWAGMPSGATAQQVAPNGYTYLENFLNEMAGDTVPAGPPADTTPPAAPANVRVH